MIKSNLAVLLAERGLKMSDLINETKLAKNTVRSLYYNEAKGIQFETLETICDYLNVNPEDVIKKIRFEYEIIDKNIDDECLKITFNIKFTYDVKVVFGTIEISLSGPDPESLFENNYSSYELSLDINYKKELHRDVISQITELECDKLENYLIVDFIETLNLENHTVTFISVNY